MLYDIFVKSAKKENAEEEFFDPIGKILDSKNDYSFCSYLFQKEMANHKKGEETFQEWSEKTVTHTFFTRCFLNNLEGKNYLNGFLKIFTTFFELDSAFQPDYDLTFVDYKNQFVKTFVSRFFESIWKNYVLFPTLIKALLTKVFISFIFFIFYFIILFYIYFNKKKKLDFFLQRII